LFFFSPLRHGDRFLAEAARKEEENLPAGT
jgi:hypothetical protein